MPPNPLADRIRAMLAGDARITEQSMFGGICFMVNGNMAVGASSARGLLVRVGKDGNAAALMRAGTRPMVMRGKPMEGYIYVDDERTKGARDLKAWVDVATTHAASLPGQAEAEAKNEIVREGTSTDEGKAEARRRQKLGLPARSFSSTGAMWRSPSPPGGRA